MIQNNNNSKYKVIKNLFNKIIQFQVISFLIVKIKLKVMIINLVDGLLKNKFKINKKIVSRLNETLACWKK
jgi:hypothetical protein